MSSTKEKNGQHPIYLSDSGEELEQIIRQSFLLFLQGNFRQKKRVLMSDTNKQPLILWRYNMYLEINKPMDYPCWTVYPFI